MIAGASAARADARKSARSRPPNHYTLSVTQVGA